MKFPTKRAFAQTNSASWKGAVMPPKSVFTTQQVILDERELPSGQKVPNDTCILAKPDGALVRIPVREIMRFRTADGKSVFAAENGAENGEIPNKFEVVSSVTRVDRNGNEIFPVQAYKLGQELLANKIQWDDCVAGGVKADNKLEPVQDYVIAVIS